MWSSKLLELSAMKCRRASSPLLRTKNHDTSCKLPAALSDFDEGAARKATLFVSLALLSDYVFIIGS